MDEDDEEVEVIVERKADIIIRKDVRKTKVKSSKLKDVPKINQISQQGR